MWLYRDSGDVCFVVVAHKFMRTIYFFVVVIFCLIIYLFIGMYRDSVAPCVFLVMCRKRATFTYNIFLDLNKFIQRLLRYSIL